MESRSCGQPILEAFGVHTLGADPFHVKRRSGRQHPPAGLVRARAGPSRDKQILDALALRNRGSLDAIAGRDGRPGRWPFTRSTTTRPMDEPPRRVRRL